MAIKHIVWRGYLATPNGDVDEIPTRGYAQGAAPPPPTLKPGLVMAGGGSRGPSVGHVTVRTLHAKGAPA